MDRQEQFIFNIPCIPSQNIIFALKSTPDMTNEILIFTGFILLILLLLFIDLGVFSKNSHVVSFRESIVWTSIWISFALAFYLLILFYGHLLHGIDSMDKLEKVVQYYQHPLQLEGLSLQEAISAFNKILSLQYLTGYIIEYSLSLDNVFVILLIFISFSVPEKYYKRVLFWGILGAIVMRFIFIFLLSALIHEAEWILILFGGILIFTGGRMAKDFIAGTEKKFDVEHHPVVRMARKLFAVHPHFVENKFWLRINGKLFITPLFIVLLVIEFSDLIFAVDSVPAIFAVSRDPFIVFFSNVFAIMGLRSLFFLVSHIFSKFYYLKIGLSALLIFIGVKMIIHFVKIDIPLQMSLLIICGILAISVVASLFHKGPAKGV